MRGCDEKIRELWHYQTTFGNLWFNVLSSFCSVVEILTICIVLGYYNEHVTFLYVWWPILECIRLFALTIARVDVMLQESQYMAVLSTTAIHDNDSDNHNTNNNNSGSMANNGNAGVERRRNVGEYTRRLIVGCNVMGLVTLVIALPLFLALLPTNNTKNPLYMLSFTVYPLFALLRVVLSIPMFATMVWGTPFYRCHDGNKYERIGEASSRGDLLPNEKQNSYSPTQDSLLNRPPRAEVPHEVLWSLYENQQTQMAIEASRRDSYRYLRTQQDKEYAEALKEQAELEKAATRPEENIETQERECSDEMTSIDNIKAEQEADVDIVVNESESLTLDPLPEEPSSGKTTVRARIRLPNGARCTRLFTNEHTLSDMKCWINHELVNNDLTNVVNRFRLISTHPRTVYEENDKTLEEVGFWRPNATRQLETPMLYVEEHME